jgi:tetratricopeptide (TPR) repeat protein
VVVVKFFAQFFLIILFSACVRGALVDDPIFKYRCAEKAFGNADYAVAGKFYGEIVTDSPRIKLAAMCGILDSLLCQGQWLAAEQYVNMTDFSSVNSTDGYDELMLRACFVFVKNQHFLRSKSILDSVNFVHLRDAALAWYHMLRFLILDDARELDAAQAELELAKSCASSAEQIETMELFNLQAIVSEIRVGTDVSEVERVLKEKILGCPPSPHLLEFSNLYSLFLNGVGRRNEAVDVLEQSLQHCTSQEDVCAVKLYHAIAEWVFSEAGLSDVTHVLLHDCSQRIKLLALKLLVGAARTSADAAVAVDALNSVLPDIDLDIVKRSIFLAKVAIFLNAGNFEACADAASKYIDSFSRDEISEHVYELLAYIALGGEVLEYRNSARYLDKLRLSACDDNVRLAITLKIADAFFYNNDFELASNMYGEALKLGSVEKCGMALVNQVISDIALGDYAMASGHIDGAACGICEKLDAIVEYVTALKREKMYDEALKYVDSIKLDGATKFAKCSLAAHRAEILLKRKQYSQAFILASKVCDDVMPKLNSKEYIGVCAQAMFTKGSAAYELGDIRAGGEAFESLRANCQNTAYFAMSFFREASFLRRSGDVPGAIAVLELCKMPEYVPHISYKIAMLKFYHDGDFKGAIGLMGEIIRDYPGTDIAVAARVAQGNILRAIGDFSSAQLVYESAQKLPNSSRNADYLSLAIAKCLIAQKNRDIRCLDRAIGVLRDLCAGEQFTDFRLECVAEYCLALKLKNKYGTLEKLAVDIQSHLDGNKFLLAEKARYWLAQIAFILRDSLNYFQADNVVRIRSLVDMCNG